MECGVGHLSGLANAITMEEMELICCGALEDRISTYYGHIVRSVDNTRAVVEYVQKIAIISQ